MKNTPRDFFLHFGAFAALYAAATALGTLLFLIIGYAFPDPLYSNYYSYGGYDPYSAPMRFAIASLIILVPLFLWLMRVIQREARITPERYTFAIRKWLTYITLFVAGATIVGDLITLLYSFLGGELATPFVLKVLVLFAITGVIFWYFLLDIRGYWQNRASASKMVGIVTVGAVLVAIIGSFFIMGSPMIQREIRFDQQEIQDLSMIQNQVVNYWQQNGTLPATLSELESDITYFHVPQAPEGREPYEYRKTGDTSFALCATFAQNSDGTYAEPYAPSYGVGNNTSWEHTAGRTCFDRTIDPSLIQPLDGKPVPFD
ncbi:hypothetical protein HY416_04455 [Candidatus Kaiserbacteria bacterium]|nr:hypothetical protein [Candidatus Kaiserbacteria bacterium]